MAATPPAACTTTPQIGQRARLHGVAGAHRRTTRRQRGGCPTRSLRWADVAARRRVDDTDGQKKQGQYTTVQVNSSPTAPSRPSRNRPKPTPAPESNPSGVPIAMPPQDLTLRVADAPRRARCVHPSTPSGCSSCWPVSSSTASLVARACAAWAGPVQTCESPAQARAQRPKRRAMTWRIETQSR
jgi:hypothetical protein